MRSIFKFFLKWALNAKAALFVTACTIYILIIYFLSDTLHNPNSEIHWEVIIFVSIILFVAIYSLNRITISEEKYRSLYDCHVDAIITIDLRGKVKNINQQFDKLFGYKLEHFSNNNWSHFIITAQRDLLEYYYQEALRGKSLNFETKINHNSGQLIEAHITFVPMMANDKVVGVYALCKDITEIKQHKSEIERLHKYYQLLLNSVTEGIVGIGDNGTINFWNRSAEKMLGWTSEEVIHQPVMDKLGIHQSCNEELHELSQMSICKEFHKCMSDKQNLVIKEIMFLRKDKTTFPTSLVISPIIECNGKQTGVVCTFQDITEYKEQEELLRKSDRLAAAGQLAAGVAHEIRNPLTALKGFLQLFPRTNFKEHHYISIMEQELLRIESIVSEFLFIAKPQPTIFAAHSLESIISETIELLKLQAHMSSIQVTMNIKSQIPPIMCDRHQLKQVFINVMKNAIEAIEDAPDGGDILIHVEHMVEHNKVKIRFTDNGCGIAPDRLEQLGEPFYSTKEKGTGLGLMVSYKIIESHGGYITFNSQLNVGTQVEIYLPFITGHESTC